MILAMTLLCATAAASSALLGGGRADKHHHRHHDAMSTAHYNVHFHLRRVHAEADIEQAFQSRADPDSPLFRKHLTSTDELRALVGASASTIARVQAYIRLLASAGEQPNCFLHSSGDILQCNRIERASAVGRALAAQMNDFRPKFDVFPFGEPNRRHLKKASEALRFEATIPAALKNDVRFIIVQRFPSASPQRTSRQQKRDGGKGKKKVTEAGMNQDPPSIQKRYAVPAKPPQAPLRFSQGVAEFEGEYFQESDMAFFFQNYSMNNATILVMGPNSPGGDDVEGTLDLQYMAAMNQGMYPTWWLEQNSSSSDPGNIDFAAWCESVLTVQPSPPTVVSISWGLGDYNYVWDPTVMSADNDAFRKLGMMGITVLAASGDSGPGVRRLIDCTTFQPSWPASSTYLTSVGATYANSQSGAEIAVTWSGGGFSDTFARQSWQDAAVKNYLATASPLPNRSFYNATGRAYPDVSALGTNFQVYIGGVWNSVSGTSCASPTFAGILSMINAERINFGFPTLGFINPIIYKLGAVGYDVTQGSSYDTDCFGLPIQGFPAIKGWDPVTGLGTPNYEFLRKHL